LHVLFLTVRRNRPRGGGGAKPRAPGGNGIGGGGGRGETTEGSQPGGGGEPGAAGGGGTGRVNKNGGKTRGPNQGEPAGQHFSHTTGPECPGSKTPGQTDSNRVGGGGARRTGATFGASDSFKFFGPLTDGRSIFHKVDKEVNRLRTGTTKASKIFGESSWVAWEGDKKQGGCGHLHGRPPGALIDFSGH